MCLIAALDTETLLWWAKVVPSVILGIGAVIFVHELGHFLVAKACGVKCPKFYLGFDVPFGKMINNALGREGEFKLFGIGIPKTIGPPIKWGETEYGIGIVPLGGYVRMLGQDDDPGNITEQLKESQAAPNANPDQVKEIIGPDGKKYLVDKRSYPAKSVPQRMAIISAGVVMNIIFAFIFATIAYKLGVPYNPSIVSETAPGSPAWQADIRPGDEVVQIADMKSPSFVDLRGSVSLADLEAGLKFVIRRGDEEITKTLHPEQDEDMPRVGIAPPESLRLGKEKPAWPFAAAAKATPALEGGDEIIAVNGQPVANHAEFSSLLVQHAAEPLKLTVRRGGKPPENDAFGPLAGGEMIEVTVPPQPVQGFGLVMEMGKVASVQDNSPAAGKIKSGDFIKSLANAETSAGAGDAERTLTIDPMVLPETLRQMADEGRDIEVKFSRASKGAGGRQEPQSVVIPLRKVTWLEGTMAGDTDSPVVATALGVAYRVLNVVARVEPDSPAAAAGLESGDVITSAKFVPPAGLSDDDRDLLSDKPITFGDDDGEGQSEWPAFVAMLQLQPAGTKVELTYARDGESETATLTPVASTTQFTPDRGWSFEWVQRNRVASSWGDAVNRGWHETSNALLMVYRFLGKLGSQVSVKLLGGPVTIAQAAGFSAAEGPGKLLVFLTMLSANLAVINFLPIPMLDGGHMAFLLWEGIRGKPAGERFAFAMHAAGFAFIITLMLFVLGLDFHRLFTT